MGYKIVEAQEPVAVFGGHNYWVLLDDNNNKLSELHGFQVDASGNISTTGSGGTLQVFSNYTMGYNASTTQQVIIPALLPML